MELASVPEELLQVISPACLLSTLVSCRQAKMKTEQTRVSSIINIMGVGNISCILFGCSESVAGQGIDLRGQYISQKFHDFVISFPLSVC
jgi:predicted benzoate:H+ symporter BenE